MTTEYSSTVFVNIKPYIAIAMKIFLYAVIIGIGLLLR